VLRNVGARAGLIPALLRMSRAYDTLGAMIRVGKASSGTYFRPREGRRTVLAAATGKWITDIVKRNELHKFVVVPKRWIANHVRKSCAFGIRTAWPTVGARQS
jgi:hypothetical protein